MRQCDRVYDVIYRFVAYPYENSYLVNEGAINIDSVDESYLC